MSHCLALCVTSRGNLAVKFAEQFWNPCLPLCTPVLSFASMHIALFHVALDQLCGLHQVQACGES